VSPPDPPSGSSVATCRWATRHGYTPSGDATCGKPARYIANEWHPDRPLGPDVPVCGIHRNAADARSWAIRDLDT
jgi:hypothetical protein